jgi:hypothetical protein
VFAKGAAPNLGASYKYTWKPDWKLPPGVRPLRVFLGVSFWIGLAAVPVFVWPSLRGPKSEQEVANKKPDVYARIKQHNREERMRWIQSPDMPPR